MQSTKLLGFGLFALLAACESNKDHCRVKKNNLCVKSSVEGPSMTETANSSFAETAGDKVFFAFDSSALNESAKETVKRQAEWLKTNPGYSVLIAGHCDERGTQEYNIGLGERRANAVAETLCNNGIPQSSIQVVSYGKDRPVTSLEACGNDTQKYHEANRVAIPVLLTKN